MSARRIALLVVLVVVLALQQARPATAEPSADEAKAAARQVLIALRVLAYDKALPARRPGQVATIVIASKTTAGRAERARWVAGFALVPKVRVMGRAVNVVAVELGDSKQFAATIAQHAPAAVILTADLADEIASITRTTRASRTLTFARQESAVKAGISVGLVAGRERDEILINLEASRAEGVRFNAGLLQLARLVDP